MLKFYITNIKQGIVLGCYVNKFFFLTLLLSFFLICTYLSHLKFNYKFFGIKFIYIVFEVVRNHEDAVKHSKIM